MTNHKWPIGTIISVEQILKEGLAALPDPTMDTLQLRLGDARQHAPERIQKLKQFLKAQHPFKVMTIAAGWSGPAVWNFKYGPPTLGLVPEAYRADRASSMRRSFEIAAELAIPLVQTHFGFVPENPSDPLYPGVVACLQSLEQYAAKLGVTLCLETGQETPAALRRLIEDAGGSHIGINLDPANLLMYGKGNPCDAVDVFGQWIRSLHIKDGDYPQNDMYKLGPEHPIGEGRVDFLCLFKKLDRLSFNGPLIIEREISGPQQVIDIRASVKKLEAWLLELS